MGIGPRALIRAALCSWLCMEDRQPGWDSTGKKLLWWTLSACVTHIQIFRIELLSVEGSRETYSLIILRILLLFMTS